MRKLKKMLSLTLALVMCLGLTVPAFATGFEGDGESTWVEWAEPVKLTLEDVVFSVDPIGVVTIQFVYEDGSAGATAIAYMFDQPASINMKDGRDFMYGYGDAWENHVYGEGLYDGVYGLTEDAFFGIDNNSNGLWRFYLEEESVQYDSPYMVSKNYVDSLIAEGRHKVDIQPYTASQPEQPGQPAVPDAPGTYTVKKGDTWSTICTNFYGTNAQRYALMKANKNVKLKEGTVLTLPEKLGKDTLISAAKAAEGEKLYTVKAGDTLGKIAAAEYGKVGEYKAIFERNADRLKNANTIYEGQVIVLPAKK